MRAAIIFAAAGLLSACNALPGKVEVDLGNGTVSAGGCTCTLPVKPLLANAQQPR